MELIVNYLWAFGILALIFVFIKNAWVAKQDEGNAKMARIAKNIADGAMSFLKAEYKISGNFCYRCGYFTLFQREYLRQVQMEWWPSLLLLVLFVLHLQDLLE